jgi:hypothetical protein
MSSEFTPEQKRYLEGFVAGIQARGGKSFLPPSAVSPAAPELKPMGPDAPYLLAQDEAITPRSRRSRTTEAAISISAVWQALATLVMARSRRCNGQRPLLEDGRFFTPSGRACFIGIKDP